MHPTCELKRSRKVNQSQTGHHCSLLAISECSLINSIRVSLSPLSLSLHKFHRRLSDGDTFYIPFNYILKAPKLRRDGITSTHSYSKSSAASADGLILKGKGMHLTESRDGDDFHDANFKFAPTKLYAFNSPSVNGHHPRRRIREGVGMRPMITLLGSIIYHSTTTHPLALCSLH